MKYYPLLKGRLDIIIDFWKAFTTFADDKKEQSSLALSAHRLIPTWRILQKETSNYERDFVEKLYSYLMMEKIFVPQCEYMW